MNNSDRIKGMTDRIEGMTSQLRDCVGRDKDLANYCKTLAGQYKTLAEQSKTLADQNKNLIEHNQHLAEHNTCLVDHLKLLTDQIQLLTARAVARSDDAPDRAEFDVSAGTQDPAETEDPADADGVKVVQTDVAVHAAPTTEFYTETFYYPTGARPNVAGDAGIALRCVQSIINRFRRGVTRGDLVHRILVESTKKRAVEEGLAKYKRAMTNLDSALDYLCEVGSLRKEDVLMLSGKEMERGRYHATPAGMGALADEWLTPGTIPDDDFRLLAMAASNKHNGLSELADRFGTPTLVRLTEAGLIARAVYDE